LFLSCWFQLIHMSKWGALLGFMFLCVDFKGSFLLLSRGVCWLDFSGFFCGGFFFLASWVCFGFVLICGRLV